MFRIFAFLVVQCYHYHNQRGFARAQEGVSCNRNPDLPLPPLIDKMMIENPLNNSLVPEYFYLRMKMAVVDAERFTEVVSRGYLHFCITSATEAGKMMKRKCDMNILEEVRINTDEFLVNDHPRSKTPNDQEGYEFFLLRFDVLSTDPLMGNHSEPLPLCAVSLKLACCAPKMYMDAKKREQKEEKVARYNAYISHLVSNEALIPTSSKVAWNCDIGGDVSRGRGREGGVIIGIKSAALNFELREATRRTWLSAIAETEMNICFCVRFLIGSFNGSEHEASLGEELVIDVKRLLETERALYGDILLGEELGGVVDS